MNDAPVNVLVLIGGAVGGAGVVGTQAVAARRLLGLHVGPVRMVIAGVLGWAAFGLIGRRLNDSVDWWLFLPMLVGASILATMGLLVAGEALVPSGGRPLLGLRRRLSRGRRYSEITAIAVRHGLRPYLRGRGGGDASVGRVQLARSLRAALEDGGATFVKLGQMSVAQVHAGRLRSGEEVVVKVQRPGIVPVVERDLDVVLRLAATVEARRRRGLSVHATIDGIDRAGLNVVGLARGFAAALREELDFRVEARNVAAVAAAHEQRGGDPVVRVPVVHEALSSRRVLVLERLYGIPLGHGGAMIDARALDRRELAAGLLHELLNQIMRDGIFHADPHPGNVLLLDDGRLGLLDFGSVGRLDPIVQGALSRLLVAVERRDAAGLRDALLDLARQPDDVDDRRLARDLERFVARHLSPGTSPGAAMFVDLFAAVDAAGLTVPPEPAAVFRTLATLDGTLRRLDPGFDVVAESREFAGAQRVSSLPHVLGEELAALLPLLGRLPRRVDRIAGALEHGRLGLNVRLLADERDRRVITTLVHQGLLAFVAAALGLMSVLLLAAHGGPLLTSTVTLYQFVGYNLLLVSLLLVLRVLFVVFRPERPR